MPPGGLRIRGSRLFLLPFQVLDYLEGEAAPREHGPASHLGGHRDGLGQAFDVPDVLGQGGSFLREVFSTDLNHLKITHLSNCFQPPVHGQKA